MEVPVSSDSEEDISDEALCILSEDLEDEVDINIHFHCEHCFKLSQCEERPKPGWCCEIIECNNGCGRRFHSCKSDEHELLCSHARIPCINAGNGCPHIIQRQCLANHLPLCPASVVVCNAEWNRWALGARERERISIPKEVPANFQSDDLDMALAIDDQRLVNDMHLQPKYLRKIMCNGITKRFPSLPLSIRGSLREDWDMQPYKNRPRSQSTTTDDEEEGLTPGLSLSVCTELLRGKQNTENPHVSSPKTNKVVTVEPMLVSSMSLDSNSSNAKEKRRKSSVKKNDDISAFCCSHGILKDLCQFCRNDPDEPDYKFGNVWRERVDLDSPGQMSWVREPRVEKIRKRNPFGLFIYKCFDESDEEEEEEEDEEVKRTGNGIVIPADKATMAIDDQGRPTGRLRFQTPPPAPLTPKGLTLEIGLKHYSRHQVKPKAMFTFHCMQEVRRDEFLNHYQNVHSEIQEGLDGWLLERCPLHIVGCSFTLKRLYPRKEEGEVVFCHSLRAFGIKPHCTSCDNGDRSSQCQARSPSFEKSQVKVGQKGMKTIPENSPVREEDTQFMASSGHITYLPVEVLQCIARYLDGFSLNNLSLTCHFMRDICFSLLNEKGLVLQEWVRTCADGVVSWKVGRNKWFFPKSFEFVREWTFRERESMSNHLALCPFNVRWLSEKKFCYCHLRKDEIPKYNSHSPP